MVIRSLTCTALACLFLVVSQTVSSASLTVNATDSGWYDDTGWHEPDNLNYAVGEEVVFIYHNFFVFDLSSVSATVTSAVINIYSPESPPQFFDGYQSMDPFETYVLYDVSTDIAVLTSGPREVAVFEDLGTGTSYGEYDVSAADNGQFVSITLNADALDNINNGAGLFAIGGAVSTIDSTPNNEIIFASSGEPSVPAPYLTLTTVPIPAAIWLFGSGLIGLAGLARRRVNA
jgi:hypothetical protein